MWAFLAIGLLPAAAPTDAPRLLTVSVDLGSLERESYDDIQASGLYKSLIVRLVEDDLAFVDAAQHADIVVRFSHEPTGRLSIAVESRAGSRERQVAFPRQADAQARMNIIHTTLGLVEKARADLTRPADAKPEAEADEPPPPAVEVAGGLPPERRWQLAVTSDALALWSDRDAGALVNLEVGARRGVFELTAGAGLHQPVGLPAELQVREWGAFLGARVRPALAGAWLVAWGGLDVGLWQHRYRYDDSAGHADDGAVFDAMGAARMGLGARLATCCDVGVQGGVLATLHDRVHRTHDAVLWRSSRGRPFLGVNIGWSP